MNKDLFGGKELRALSWKEPYASLMLHGKIETRPWSTDYRGLVLICATKKPYGIVELIRIAGRHYDRIQNTLVGYNDIIDNNLGHAIAIGELVDCRAMNPEDEDACFVKWRGDLYCHIYEDMRAIEPIPFKGQQGWKKLDINYLNSVTYI